MAGMSMSMTDAERIFTDRYTAGVARTFVFIALGWHVGNDLPATIAGGLHPVAVATWVAYAVVAAIGAPLVLRGRSAGPVLTGVGCVVLLAGSAAMHATQPGSLFVFPNWAWQAAGWMALLLFWNRAFPGFLVFVVANAALSTAALLTRGDSDRQDLAMMLMVLYGVAALQLALDVGKRGLETIALRSARDRAAAEALLTARLAAEQAHEARQDRYASARAAAGEVLKKIADGTLDPGDAQVRGRAAGAAARLRRLVTETDDVPDPLVHALRAAADIAERRGVAVTVDQVGTVPDVPLQVRRALTDAPAWAVAAAATRARITVVSNARSVTIAVVGDGSIDQPRWDPPSSNHHDGVVVTTEGEGGQIWVETRWSNAPSESLLESPSSTTTRSSSTGSGPGRPPTPRDGSTSS
ncbi:hypothetical protein GCM10009558_060890 [Virgisporangium aurantiacum]